MRNQVCETENCHIYVSTLQSLPSHHGALSPVSWLCPECALFLKSPAIPNLTHASTHIYPPPPLKKARHLPSPRAIMSASLYGKYTDDGDDDPRRHNHDTAVIGGPPSRHRHTTLLPSRISGEKWRRSRWWERCWGSMGSWHGLWGGLPGFGEEVRGGLSGGL